MASEKLEASFTSMPSALGNEMAVQRALTEIWERAFPIVQEGQKVTVTLHVGEKRPRYEALVKTLRIAAPNSDHEQLMLDAADALAALGEAH